MEPLRLLYLEGKGRIVQTPISFILDLILDYELPADVRKRCRKYVRELEENLVSKPLIAPARLNAVEQAPSTQRLLALQEQVMPGLAPTPIPPPPIAGNMTPPAKIDKETGRAMVPTGRGTLGPRKF